MTSHTTHLHHTYIDITFTHVPLTHLHTPPPTHIQQAYQTFTWNFLLRIMLGKLMDVKWVEQLLQPKLGYFSAKMRGIVGMVMYEREGESE